VFSTVHLDIVSLPYIGVTNNVSESYNRVLKQGKQHMQIVIDFIMETHFYHLQLFMFFYSCLFALILQFIYYLEMNSAICFQTAFVKGKGPTYQAGRKHCVCALQERPIDTVAEGFVHLQQFHVSETARGFA